MKNNEKHTNAVVDKYLNLKSEVLLVWLSKLVGKRHQATFVGLLATSDKLVSSSFLSRTN